MIFFERKWAPQKKKKMGASWAPCPFFFFEKMGSQKKKKVGSAHFLGIQKMGAHLPYIPTRETEILTREKISTFSP